MAKVQPYSLKHRPLQNEGQKYIKYSCNQIVSRKTCLCNQRRFFYTLISFFFLLFVLSLRRFTSRIVDKLKEYKVAHRSLGEGQHIFHFVLDDVFFNCFEATKGTKGRLEAGVTIIKSSLLMEINMKIEGSVKATCDRCLGIFDLQIKGELNLYVKQGSREADNEDDFIILAPEDDFLDLSSYLYEIYMLNYPIRVVHEEGHCDAEMEKVLDEYITDEKEKPADPRWDELKKLINN